MTFEHVKEGPPDAIFLVKQQYQADPSEMRLDVGIGAYRDANGKPYVLDVVRKAEALIAADKSRNKEYLAISGDNAFIGATQKLLFGQDSLCLKDGKVATVQSLSGTGALRVGAEFLAEQFPGVKIYVPNPTWGNHINIFTRAGLEVGKYRYWRQKTRDLDFEGMLGDLEKVPNGSVVVLHVCSHNPTGVDPSHEQWGEILELVKRKNIIPFFDSAYQGFASGDLEKDAFSVRLFAQNDVPLLCAQSYSKNMGLYGERIGALNVLCDNASLVPAVLSQLNIVIRPNYSNPPRHGAAIASKILTDPVLFDEWKVELKRMSDRIVAMRHGLRKLLEDKGTPGDWSFITNQIGMFTYTGLSATQVDEMTKNYHIYMPGTGRISIAGLTEPRLEQMADAIRSVL
uniref:Aspartate aminotransferase n=2 Tax=Sar TaxID=2698737 RepID=A0A7S3V0Z1_9STRA|mmetsp:Transcript_9738/g.12163  ORF Transcript_9738/g.12163 Transcript_9738/m.12163 type:complete len:400 (+) Transcript_9738:87-1286(+)